MNIVKKLFVLIIILAIPTSLLLAARTQTSWFFDNTGYISPAQAPVNVLISGTNRYLNFGTFSGSSGYGFRDNSGTMEFKNSGGSWTAFGTGSGGSSSGGTWATTTSTVAGQLINYPNNTTDIVVIGSNATTTPPKFYFDPNTSFAAFLGRLSFQYASGTGLTLSGMANFANASTTGLSANYAQIGSSATTTITGAGEVGINTLAPAGWLDVNSKLVVSKTGFGTTTVTGFTVNGSATSTSNVGFNITTGCYAISGVCISGSGGGGSGTVTSVTLATPSATLTLGGTNPVTTSGTINADLNLGHSNTWTILQSFNYSSSTIYSSFVTASTTNLVINGQTFTSLLGTGLQNVGGALTINTSGTWSGNAGTATALAANGTNCSSGSFPLGVDASGNSENCTVATTGTVTSITAGAGHQNQGLVITSTGTLVGAIATSATPVINPQGVAVWTGVGDTSNPAKLGTQATSTCPTFSTGLSYSGTAANCIGGTNGNVTVNTSQNIATLSNLTTNGFITTSGSVGTLGVQTFPISLAQGGTGTTLFPANSVITSNSAGTALIASTSQLTVGNLISTTSAVSLFTGNVGIGTTTAGTALSIGATGTGINFADNATSTFSGKGINLLNGCFAIAGTCVGGGSGGGSGTVTSVAATVPVGFSISGSPITTSGTLAITTNLPANSLVASNSVGTGIVATTTPTFGAFNATSTTATSTIANALSITGGGNNYLQVGPGPSYSYLPEYVGDVGKSLANDFVSFNVYNNSNTGCASADLTTGNAMSNAFLGYSDLGITSNIWTGTGCSPNQLAQTGVLYDSTYLLNPSGPQMAFWLGTTTPVWKYTWGGGGYAASNVLMQLNGAGRLSVGTTTPSIGVQTNASSTAPQLVLSDGTPGIAQWTFRNAGGNLYVGTTTVQGTATTSTAALTLLGGTSVPSISSGTTTPIATYAFNADNGLTGNSTSVANIFAVASSSATQFRIDNTGNVYLPVTAAFSTGDSALCQRAGSGLVTVDSGVSSCIVSSMFTKDFIKKETYAEAKRKIDALNVIIFKYKDSGKEDIGLYAEEVSKIDPRYAQYEDKEEMLDGHKFKVGDPKAVNWTAIQADMIVVLQHEKSTTQSGTLYLWILLGIFGGWNLLLTLKKRV